jgi:outer membrane lipoprotein-sorting protein
MLRIIVISVCLIIGVQANAQKLNSVQADSVLNLLTKRAKTLKSQSMDFNLVKNIKGLQNPIKQEGKINLENPDKLRYEVIGSKPWKMVVNGKNVYTKAGNSPIEKSGIAMKKVRDFIFKSVNGEALVGKEFNKSLELNDQLILVTLTPASGILKKHVSEIIIWFDNSHDVTRFSIEQPNGNSTVYSFSNMQRNIVLKESLFLLK